MIPFNERTLNIDAGPKCTLQCSACARQRFAEQNRRIPGKDLTPEQFRKIIKYFKHVSFCGTFSDPIFNVHFIDLLKIAKEENIKVEIKEYQEKIERETKNLKPVDQSIRDIEVLKDDKSKIEVQHNDILKNIDNAITEQYDCERLINDTEQKIQTYEKDNVQEKFAQLEKLEQERDLFQIEVDKLKADVKVKLENGNTKELSTLEIINMLEAHKKEIIRLNAIIDNFKNIENIDANLSGVFKSFQDILNNNNSEHGFANSQARLRMTTLYQIAASNHGIVVGTGNKVEDFGIGFYTKYGDGGVDISPIADCLKTEIWEMGKALNINQEIIDSSDVQNHSDITDHLPAIYKVSPQATPPKEDLSFDVSAINLLLLGWLSSGTSYALCMLISDGGFQYEYRIKGSVDSKMDAKTSNKLLQG